jgi:hypothetical protein
VAETTYAAVHLLPFTGRLRILWLALPALVLEVGWLALWPLSAALSHSPAFTAAFLGDHPLAARLLEVTHSLAGNLPEAPLTEPLGSPAYVQPAVAIAAVMLWLAAAYLLGLKLLSSLASRNKAVWLVIAATLVYQATLAWLPGLFSQDVFSYIAYGRLAAVYDLNPYVWPPSAVAKDAILPWVASVWRTYPAPYGPLWLDVQWTMQRLFGSASIQDQALAYRLLANVLLLANLGLAWRLLGRLTPLSRAQRTTALASLAWNPLVLFEIAANAHNDVMMVTFSLLGLLLFTRSNNGIASVASFWLGALVKYLSGLGLVWVAIAAVASSGRILRLVWLALISVAIALIVAWPWLELPDSLEPLLAETAGVGYVNALPDGLALAVGDHVLGRDLARAMERLLIVVGFGAYLIWEARRVWADATPAAVARACGRSILIYVLAVSTSVQTWYFYLPMALLIVLGWHQALTRVTVSYSLLALPALYLRYYLRDATPIWIDVAYALAPLVWLVPRLRARPGRHEPAAIAVGDDEQRAERHRVAGAVVEQARR